MKQQISLIYFILITISFGHSNVYALDALAKIELRNGYKQFKKCMENSKNDITECLKEFNKAVDVHKEALKTEPENEKIKKTLLVMVNTMNDIAITYYSAAEEKKGVNPSFSAKYYTKAGICFDQLMILYPNKAEFKEKSANSKYLAKYEEVEENVLELKNRKRIDYARLSLQKLKVTRDSFNTSFGQNEKLNNSINETVIRLEGKVNQFFHNTIQKQDPEDMKLLIFLAHTQFLIVDFQNKPDYINNLTLMEKAILDIVSDLTKGYRADFQKAISLFDKNNFTASAKAFDQLYSEVVLFPDYSSARPKFKSQIIASTNTFNAYQFLQTIEHKSRVAKSTDTFLSMIDEGKNAFKQKNWEVARDKFFRAEGFATGKELAVNKNITDEWLNKVRVTESTDRFMSMIESGKKAFKQKNWDVAYYEFKEAKEFAKDKKLSVNANIAMKWFKKVKNEIEDLDEDEITSIRLAELYYKPMSYYEWNKAAKNGKFPKKYVSLSGKFQQKIGKVVILKKGTLEYSSLIEDVYESEQLNSMGIILKNNKRLFREDDHISCIGRFKKTDIFTSLFGEIEIPIFKAIYVE